MTVMKRITVESISYSFLIYHFRGSSQEYKRRSPWGRQRSESPQYKRAPEGDKKSYDFKVFIQKDFIL